MSEEFPMVRAAWGTFSWGTDLPRVEWRGCKGCKPAKSEDSKNADILLLGVGEVQVVEAPAHLLHVVGYGDALQDQLQRKIYSMVTTMATHPTVLFPVSQLQEEKSSAKEECRDEEEGYAKEAGEVAQPLEAREKEQEEQWKQLGSQAHPGQLLLKKEENAV